MPRKSIPRVSCTCEACGKTFLRTLSDVRRGRDRHCSRSCALRKPKAPNRVCPRCGTPVYRTPSQLASRANVYCSVACATNSRPTEPLWRRIWRRVDYGGPGCWAWTGGVDASGYGVVSLGEDGKRRPHHVTRLIWRLIHGTFPRNACHRCDNPVCCRPSHLFDGTKRDNNRDAWTKGRAYTAGGRLRGAESASAKLTDDLVRAMRRRRADGGSYSALARAYGVSPQTVKSVCDNRTWKHVT